MTVQGTATVLCLMGPTAVGKSAVALELATKLPVEIVSVDSALVYRGMDVGTAKPELEVRARVRHHLIDIRDPNEVYSAAAFVQDAQIAIEDSLTRGSIPLLVGGTMLYFKAFKHGLADLPRASPAVRAEFRHRLERDGARRLHRELERIDPLAAARIHENDPQRLIRALEVFRLSGLPISSWWARAEAPPASARYRLLEIALIPERARLHAAIEARFDEMLTRGLVDEVRALLARGLSADIPAMRAVGYRQVIAHLEGRTSYEEMRRASIAATRQLAKRQLTWLAQWRDATVLDPIRVDAAHAILNSLGAARIVGRS